MPCICIFGAGLASQFFDGFLGGKVPSGSGIGRLFPAVIRAG